MKQHLLVVMALATLFCFSREAYAQYPGMRQEAWYKENVLKVGTPDAIVEEVEPETEGVLQQMQKMQAEKKWNDMLALYPQAKEEYGRNRQVYGYARFALRNLLGENSTQQMLDSLDRIYADYFGAGFNPDTYSYQGRDNGNQWNEMQQMLDYARFSSCVDLETRSARIMTFVNAQEGKADPWIIYNGVMLPINEQMIANIDKIRKDDKKAEEYYLRLTEIQTELEREDALLKVQSPQYPLYGMDRKLEAIQTNRMLVIPFREYVKLYPESEIDAHKTDEAYLSKRSEEMSARWPKEALTKKVENYYANIGATYAKFKTLGTRSMDQKNYADAISNFQRSLELAENDNQRAEGYYYIAYANYAKGTYLQAWNNLNKAIEIINNDMRFYNLKYNVLIGLTGTTSGQYQRLDMNVLITTAIQTLTKAKSLCEREGQEREYDRCDANMVEARKHGRKYAIEKAQLFMKGLSFGQMYQMQSGDVKLSAPLTEY